MDRTLFNKDGDPIAYITDDYDKTIYLWEGFPVAYLYDDQYVYGFNGLHLGWFIDDILFDNDGNRIGFTIGSCPVAVAKEPVKNEKYPKDEIRSRWKASPLPHLGFDFADQDLAAFLKEGQVAYFSEKETFEGPGD